MLFFLAFIFYSNKVTEIARLNQVCFKGRGRDTSFVALDRLSAKIISFDIEQHSHPFLSPPPTDTHVFWGKTELGIFFIQILNTILVIRVCLE